MIPIPALEIYPMTRRDAPGPMSGTATFLWTHDGGRNWGTWFQNDERSRGESRVRWRRWPDGDVLSATDGGSDTGSTGATSGGSAHAVALDESLDSPPGDGGIAGDLSSLQIAAYCGTKQDCAELSSATTLNLSAEGTKSFAFAKAPPPAPMRTSASAASSRFRTGSARSSCAQAKKWPTADTSCLA